MPKPIKSLQQLKSESEQGAEFFILLGSRGALRSSKWILWEEEENVFIIRNFIDESEQELTQHQIMDKSFTNIGYAMSKGALFKDN